jgi:hypothetical protein
LSGLSSSRSISCHCLFLSIWRKKDKRKRVD